MEPWVSKLFIVSNQFFTYGMSSKNIYFTGWLWPRTEVTYLVQIGQYELRYWRFARFQGSSHLHCISPFAVSVPPKIPGSYSDNLAGCKKKKKSDKQASKQTKAIFSEQLRKHKLGLSLSFEQNWGSSEEQRFLNWVVTHFPEGGGPWNIWQH